NPLVMEHLANQYVAGCMTWRVRNRMDNLISNTPQLEREVSFWADQFSAIQATLPTVEPSVKTWETIQKHVKASVARQRAKENELLEEAGGWWTNLSLWRTASFSGLAASALLALALINVAPTPPGDIVKQTPEGAVTEVKLGVDYMAAMVSKGDASNTIKFIISAYKKQPEKPSRLVVQWSKRHKRAIQEGLHLWAEDKDTGAISYIGLEPADKGAWNLNKDTWKALSNSSHLLVTSSEQAPSDENVLFRGQCVQLGAWKKA
ncbi:MAG: hypothetical protein ACI9I4_001215, partial [Neolewinella sp.]